MFVNISAKNSKISKNRTILTFEGMSGSDFQSDIEVKRQALQTRK